jgi:hypothetical protein
MRALRTLSQHIRHFPKLLWGRLNLSFTLFFGDVYSIFANMSVGAKHSGSKYQITTNNLYTGMLRFKTEMHPDACTTKIREVKKEIHEFNIIN